jgi:putative SOS response-associated peptidase YedK
MCGRYYRRSDKQRIGDAFNIADLPSSLILSEDYNVAPTTFQPVIRNDKETGDRELVLMRWGVCGGAKIDHIAPRERRDVAE